VNLTEGRLRAALLQTAEQIPPDAVPRLDLPAEDLRRASVRHRWPDRRPPRSLTALAAAASVCLIVSVSLIVSMSITAARGPRPRAANGPPAASYLAQVPPYYVALQKWPGCRSCAQGDAGNNTNPDQAVVRSTRTGNTLATVAVPRPYATFAFVQGTADDRTFILGAQRLSQFNSPPTRLYLLRLEPSAKAGKRAQLSALPVPLLPAASGYELDWLALSPDGHLLATISTTTAGNSPTQLRVFDLATGASRTWTLPVWAGRLDNYVDVSGPPTWAPDSRHLAFFSRTQAGNTDLVLLDTSAPATSFGADTSSTRLPRPARGHEIIYGPDSPLLTADGQHVIETVISLKEASHPSGRPFAPFELDLVNLSTGAVTRLRQHSQMPFALASAPSGSAVIVATANLPPYQAGFALSTAHGSTPIQMPADTIAVAW
jgi:hypothetical protein